MSPFTFNSSSKPAPGFDLKCMYGCKDRDYSHLTFVLARKYECEMNFVLFTSRNTKQDGKEDKTHFNMYRESISYFC